MYCAVLTSYFLVCLSICSLTDSLHVYLFVYRFCSLSKFPKYPNKTPQAHVSQLLYVNPSNPQNTCQCSPAVQYIQIKIYINIY